MVESSELVELKIDGRIYSTMGSNIKFINLQVMIWYNLREPHHQTCIYFQAQGLKWIEFSSSCAKVDKKKIQVPK